jgi:hypothetical protein
VSKRQARSADPAFDSPLGATSNYVCLVIRKGHCASHDGRFPLINRPFAECSVQILKLEASVLLWAEFQAYEPIIIEVLDLEPSLATF